MKQVQEQALEKEFELCGMKEGETVDEYFARTLAFVSKMRIHAETVEQMLVVDKILGPLTARFDYVVCSIFSIGERIWFVKRLKCHILGHFQYEFPTWDEKANYAEFDEEEEMLFMVHIETKWYLMYTIFLI